MKNELTQTILKEPDVAAVQIAEALQVLYKSVRDRKIREVYQEIKNGEKNYGNKTK